VWGINYTISPTQIINDLDNDKSQNIKDSNTVAIANTLISAATFSEDYYLSTIREMWNDYYLLVTI
jgi:hypothetical protein